MTAEQWRKKPVGVEVMRWTGGNLDEMRAWVGPSKAHALNVPVMMGRSEPEGSADLHVREQDGTLRVKVGEYLVRDPDGSMYRVSEKVLQKNYTQVALAKS